MRVSRAAWILVAIHGELYAGVPTDLVSGKELPQ